MALKPEDMQQSVEIANMDLVNQLEREMDEWLANQPKGQREYMKSWKQEDYTVPIRTVDLELLGERYKTAGWNVEYTKWIVLATMILKRPVRHRSMLGNGFIEQCQMDRSVPSIREPVIGSPQQPL